MKTVIYKVFFSGTLRMALRGSVQINLVPLAGEPEGGEYQGVCELPDLNLAHCEIRVDDHGDSLAVQPMNWDEDGLVPDGEEILVQLRQITREEHQVTPEHFRDRNTSAAIAMPRAACRLIVSEEIKK